MDKMSQIKKDSSSIKLDIEKKLYWIKSCNYKSDENFQKEFGFKFDTNVDNNSMVVKFDKKVYIIEQKSRLITFIIDEVKELRFIYSCEYLKDVINEYEIKYFSTQKKYLDNSLESEISNNEIYDIFNQEDISTIYKIKSSCEKMMSYFENRYTIQKDKISDLSLNSKYYYPENSDDKLDSTIFNDYDNILNKYMWDDSINIIYLMGPKGASKSLFLMNFCRHKILSNNPSLYINYNILKNLEPKQRKYIFKKEMLYLFSEENAFKDFYNQKYHRLIKNKESPFIHSLTEFIKILVNIYKNYFKKKITLVIDNFNEDNENLNNEIEQLINLINSNSSKIILIISGNSYFLKQKFLLFLTNGNLANIIEYQKLFIYDAKLKNDNEIKSLAAFNYRKNINDEELENTLIKEEMQYCKKFNIYGMHFSVINNGKKLKIDDLLKYFYVLPFEYLTFSISENNFVTFEYFNPIFLNAVKKFIKSEIKEKSLKFLLSCDNKDFLINGIYEEKLLCTLISYNKLNLKNMDTSEDNLLEVDKISEIKDKKFKKINHKIDKALPIIITQKIFLGEHYDLLILIPNTKNDKNEIKYNYTAYMIQIGTNKPKNNIDIIQKDFNDNKKKYISGIKAFIDNNIDIKDIELLFIFDRETQENLYLTKDKLNISGSKYCIQNKIKFYCFSLVTYELYITFDNQIYYNIINFGNFSESIKKNWMHYSLEKLRFLSEKEIRFINSKISGDIVIYSSLVSFKKNVTFSDVKQDMENNKVYILDNQMHKYIIINCEIYKYIIDKHVKINEKEVDKKEKFNLFIITLSELIF